MARIYHRELTDIAANISENLLAAIDSLDPITLEPIKDLPLPELLCRTVAGQQLSTKAAETIWGRVENAVAGNPFMPFVSSVDPDVLKACGLSKAKTKTIIEIATSFGNGELCETKLKNMPYKERAQQLKTIWGVGPWTADMINMFYYCEPDIWPEQDLSVNKTLSELCGNNTASTEIAAHFSPYRTYLAMYLWRFLDSTPT